MSLISLLLSDSICMLFSDAPGISVHIKIKFGSQ